jgi:hypothetical protein
MEASMSNMHFASKFTLDNENCEKQWFANNGTKHNTILMQSMPTFLQAWIENQISNLSYAKNLFL